MSTTDDGKKAEKLVSRELQKVGHRIVFMNWRTRWCEIDIVSKNKNCVYFTEVKYRGSDKWGGGFDYITPKKLKQMNFAAELWLNENNWSKECVLQVAEVNAANEVKVIELTA